jgi:shikimate dehydrogenase
MTTIRLGLIGDNIAASSAPRFHILAGQQNGVEVSYDRLVPKTMGRDFDAVFDAVRAAGYRGINVTYPYKECAAARVRIDDPQVRALGAVNTVLFEGGEPRGFNTDHSGFIAAYRTARGETPPGPVLVIGSGGVGRAIAFALAGLGAADLRLADTDPRRAEALAAALGQAAPGLRVTTGTDAEALAAGAAGLVNATPVGMVGYPGSPLPSAAMAGATWAFDAVYTPVDTRFLGDAAAAGLGTITGYDLFIGQGVDAWRLFTGLPLDVARLRADLAAATPA